MYEFLAKALLNIKGNIKFIELKEPRCKIYLPDDTIWALLREIYLLKIYGDIENLNGIVIDAGAHCGSFSIPVSFYAKEVIAIEPNPTILKILELNKLINSRENIKILPYALYYKKEKVKLKLEEFSEYNSINEKWGFEVQTITLDEILENYDEISLLKIDIEGAEFDVLLNTKPENLRKIKRIVGELHYENENLRDKLKNYLTSIGFDFVEIEKSNVYTPTSILKALRNSKNIKGNAFNKLLNYLYLILPIRKPIISSIKKEKVTSFECKML
ncbi:MAG: FkbM family methyltransferase [candidate division WOR-3 bacterium]